MDIACPTGARFGFFGGGQQEDDDHEGVTQETDTDHPGGKSATEDSGRAEKEDEQGVRFFVKKCSERGGGSSQAGQPSIEAIREDEQQAQCDDCGRSRRKHREEAQHDRSKGRYGVCPSKSVCCSGPSVEDNQSPKKAKTGKKGPRTVQRNCRTGCHEHTECIDKRPALGGSRTADRCWRHGHGGQARGRDFLTPGRDRWVSPRSVGNDLTKEQILDQYDPEEPRQSWWGAGSRGCTARSSSFASRS